MSGWDKYPVQHALLRCIREVRACTALMCLMMLGTLASNAHAVSKADYAFGYTLEVDGDGAIYSVDLPEEIYRGLTRADRGDLCVFNSRGEAVPHALRRAVQPAQQTPATIKLPIFALYMKDSVTPVEQGDNAQITTNDQGAIIDINYGKGTLQTRHLGGYLIDASQLARPPNALHVTWPAEQGDFVVSFRLEHSDDLVRWQTLVENATFSNLHYGMHNLVQQRIELPVTPYKYLRLRWQANRSLVLDEIVAQFPARDMSQERKWTSFSVTDTDDRQHYYYFDTHAVLPVDRISLVQVPRNTLMRARIESAGAYEGPWTSHYTGPLYNLQVDGQVLTTPDIWLDATMHRYWRIQGLTDAGKLDSALQLRLGWVSEQLLFVAQGEAPFVLAYGSARVYSVKSPPSQLSGLAPIEQGQLIKAAQLGSRIKLGDSSRLEPPGTLTGWQRMSMWSALVLGLILLAWRALRCYRKIDGDSE